MMQRLEPYIGVIKAVLLVALGVLLFAAGWHVNGWRLNGQIEQLKAARAADQAVQATAALADLTAAADKINKAAGSAHVDVAGLNTKLDQIRKDFRDAKPAPLPADCRPDAVRVRELAAAADAVDQAVTRQRSGSGLQAGRSP